jgi:hypothetical protein
VEKELKRCLARLEIAKSESRAARQDPKLEELKEARQTAYYTWLRSYQAYMNLLRENIFQVREFYLETLADYWEQARIAAHTFKIPKLTSNELEIEWTEIRERTGPMWG